MSSSVTGVRHAAVEAVAVIDAGIDAVFAASLWSMPAAELAEVVVAVEKLSRRLAGVQLAVLAQADACQVGARTGATSTAVWLRNVADVPIGVGKARLGLHHDLINKAVTAAALRAGQISLEAATAVAAAMNALPGQVPAALTSQVEQLLVEVARDDGTRAVTHAAADITGRYAPDQLEKAEQASRARRWLTLTQRHDGTVSLRGVLDTEAGALALAVLGPLAAPAPATDRTPDPRDAGQRYADAFTQLCQLATPQLPAVRGERPHLLITISLDALQHKLATSPARLDTGTAISAAAARRIGCDANLIPIVLGTRGEPLDIGRTARAIPTGLRRALIARDGGCAFPGCDRPPSWCDAHHRIHWADGGPTNLHNTCLLCAHHHDTVHHDGWTITMILDQPWFTPPPWIDPTQTPRQHHRRKTAQLKT